VQTSEITVKRKFDFGERGIGEVRRIPLPKLYENSG
jgi:hypothetical protein